MDPTWKESVNDESALKALVRAAVVYNVGGKRMTQEESDFPKGLSAPARRALDGAGYRRLKQLTGVREADLRKLHGMGPKAINLLRQALEEKGLSFADDKSSKR